MDFVLIAVVLLFVLAASDLVVGVSNDAVNFLNSAIGARVASRRVILLVASLGILLGATFASGMMEVARKGIFHPEAFVLAEVMAIFLAVMLTDILLLDLFNTYGLPTSTTVSIVFELLGAAVAVALFRLTAEGEAWTRLPEYINGETAGTIVLGIFLSVGIAFTVGAVAMFGARLLFTFRSGRAGRLVHAAWGGLALTAIGHFLLLKGLKGASFIPEAFTARVESHTAVLLAGTWVLFTVLAAALLAARVPLLRVVVLAGTFALAMAFAGNDLVNFIGVPLAGLEAWRAWAPSGESPDAFSMESLAAAYRADTSLLLAAGAIMVVTLWFSRKARSVTETEVNLARQDAGTERFRGNPLARALVRAAAALGGTLGRGLPAEWRRRVEARFAPPAPDPDAPAFDLVRASVNLTVASVLIALATSRKLPLSTTYVSFMVAMGSSLADRAWGRESAVYRVSGVLSVIGGWFFTAAAAFTVAGTFALAIRAWGAPAVLVLAALAATALWHGFRLHRERRRREERRADDAPAADRAEHEDLAGVLETVARAQDRALAALAGEDRRALARLEADLAEALETNGRRLHRSPHGASGLRARRRLLDHDLRQELLANALQQVRDAGRHVADWLPPLHEDRRKALAAWQEEAGSYLRRSAEALRAGPPGPDRAAGLRLAKRGLLGSVDRLLAERPEGTAPRGEVLYLRWLLHGKDVVALAARLVRLHARAAGPDDPAHRPLLLEPDPGDRAESTFSVS
jgi:phosphate/sulfate permease